MVLVMDTVVLLGLLAAGIVKMDLRKGVGGSDCMYELGSLKNYKFSRAFEI